MTPVQLPEVPAPVAYWWGAALLYPGQIDQSQRDEADALITHEQARRYATQAVMAERARIKAELDSAIRESVFSNFDRVRNDQWAVVTGPSTIVMSVHSAVLAILSTQPEQNSDP